MSLCIHIYLGLHKSSESVWHSGRVLAFRRSPCSTQELTDKGVDKFHDGNDSTDAAGDYPQANDAIAPNNPDSESVTTSSFFETELNNSLSIGTRNRRSSRLWLTTWERKFNVQLKLWGFKYPNMNPYKHFVTQNNLASPTLQSLNSFFFYFYMERLSPYSMKERFFIFLSGQKTLVCATYNPIFVPANAVIHIWMFE